MRNLNSLNTTKVLQEKDWVERYRFPDNSIGTMASWNSDIHITVPNRFLRRWLKQEEDISAKEVVFWLVNNYQLGGSQTAK
jgi:hypothetical protein